MSDPRTPTLEVQTDERHQPSAVVLHQPGALSREYATLRAFGYDSAQFQISGSNVYYDVATDRSRVDFFAIDRLDAKRLREFGQALIELADGTSDAELIEELQR